MLFPARHLYLIFVELCQLNYLYLAFDIYFLWKDLFIIFESKASLTVLSLFTVLTLGEIKFLSEHLFSFVMCFSASIF